jgi:MFS family permease
MLMGAGVAAVFTDANVLVGGRYPAAQQPAVYGWMQTLTTVGTVFGLMLAGIVNHLRLDPEVGFAVAGALALAAALLAPLVVPSGSVDGALARHGSGVPETSLPATPPAVPPSRTELLPFATLLALWMAASLGLNAVGALYPLLMRHEFHVEPAVSSYFLAAATVVQAMLYLPASSLSARRGELRVLQGGFGVRLVSLLMLALMAATPLLQLGWLAFLPYAACVLAWPMLSISSGLLSTRLNASGVGLFTASGALASLAGPMIGGHAADTFGYTSVWLLAAGGVGVALLLSLALTRPLAGIRPLSPDGGAAGSAAR